MITIDMRGSYNDAFLYARKLWECLGRHVKFWEYSRFNDYSNWDNFLVDLVVFRDKIGPLFKGENPITFYWVYNTPAHTRIYDNPLRRLLQNCCE